MNVVVTGGLGFIGSILSRSLIQKGHQVHIIDNGIHALVKDVPGAKIDMCRANAHSTLFLEKPDVVVHAAAKSWVAACEEDPMLAVEMNCSMVEGFLQKLVSQFGKVLFVNASSCAVYNSAGRWVTEDHPVAPTSVYAMTKVIVERHLKAVSGDKIKSVSLRFSNIVGAGYGIVEGSRNEDRLIPSLFRAIDNRKTFVQNGMCVRDYLHVMDAVDGIVKAIQALKTGRVPGRGEAYNICSGKAYTTDQVVDVVTEVTGKKVCVEKGLTRPGDAIHTAPSNGLAKKTFRWTPKRTLYQSVKDAWRTHVKHSRNS